MSAAALYEDPKTDEYPISLFEWVTVSYDNYWNWQKWAPVREYRTGFDEDSEDEGKEGYVPYDPNEVPLSKASIPRRWNAAKRIKDTIEVTLANPDLYINGCVPWKHSSTCS